MITALRRPCNGPTFQVTVCYKWFVRREFSAGGVVVRRLRGRWVMAAIRPAGKEPGVWALPKGNIGPGEKPERPRFARWPRRPASRRDSSRSSATCATSTPGTGERIFKVVSFYLLRYSRGRLGDLPPETAHEVDEARWLPLEEAPKLLGVQGRAGDGREGDFAPCGAL